MPIRSLPPLLVNQIAAGEVIERPASVVKELVENSVDGGATRINMAIEQGGKELIQVIDDGCGIAEAELPLALAPHATSKLARAEDLEAIMTLGFRGEALASIASISRLSVLSRPAEQTSAALIEAEGDRITPPRPSAGPVGTAVTVRNLFFNTPARRKFLKTDPTETGRITELVETLALAHPSLGFTLTVDGRQRLDFPSGQSVRDRVLDVLGRELEADLLEVDHHQPELTLWALIGTPAIARSTARHQRYFVNSRPIADKSIAHAVKEAYRGLLDPTMHPVAAVFISVHPSQVDVNVHPTKAEVRFRNQSVIHGAVLSALRSRLRAADLVPEVSFARSGWNGPVDRFMHGAPMSADASVAPAPPWSLRAPAAPEARLFTTEVKPVVTPTSAPTPAIPQAGQRTPSLVGPDAAPASMNVDAGPIPATHESIETAPVMRTVEQALQVHSSYIVTQDSQGILIIDQHALHERVMFERLKARVMNGGTRLDSQQLLMPAVMPVDAGQVEMLDRLGALLERLGIETRALGPQSVGIHAFPCLLLERGVDPIEFMGDLLARAAQDARKLTDDPEAALHEVLDMMACKAAVKAGDHLSPAELGDLLRMRETIERSTSCPHGRPTTLRLSLRELERQFGRR